VLNPGPETGYPDCKYRDIPQSLQENFGKAPYIKLRPLPRSFQYIIHLWSYDLILCNLIS
jgi:hypothetical protein